MNLTISAQIDAETLAQDSNKHNQTEKIIAQDIAFSELLGKDKPAASEQEIPILNDKLVSSAVAKLFKLNPNHLTDSVMPPSFAWNEQQMQALMQTLSAQIQATLEERCRAALAEINEWLVQTITQQVLTQLQDKIPSLVQSSFDHTPREGA